MTSAAVDGGHVRLVVALAGFVDDGLDTIVFWPVHASPSQVERLIGEVMPPLAAILRELPR